jgi:predicted ATPase/class 3 adenylate cyclase
MNDRPLPTGTVTYLFTDIEGSTRLVQDLGEAWPETLAAHSAILGDAIDSCRGVTVRTEGDSFFAVFEEPLAAVEAAVTAQRGIESAHWRLPLRVRVGLHTGAGHLGGDDYVGLDVHRAARIADAAHGGQLVASEATIVEVDRRLPPGVTIKDLGKFRLKDLYNTEAIFQLDIEGLQRDFLPLRTLDIIPNNLPDQMTPFIGRRAEIADAIRLLDRVRLLTLTGPGGTGKTRLALQIAAEVSHRYSDGAFFAGLSPVSDVDVVPSVILGSLGLSASGDESPRERLLAELGDKRLLLVLDNFEHILEAADLVAEIVRIAPRSQFLVTSRAPLRIVGEQELAVPPLDVPKGRSVESALASESVQLLVERAQSVRADFDIDESNAEYVVELIEGLDGLPLAIELVTSRLRQFSVRTILERLDSRMLAAGSIDLPERQRTIEATIAWSHDLLDPPIKALFARMSVFTGGAQLEELERFYSHFDENFDLFDGLSELIDQSLVTRDSGASGERYRMLHVIREFAAARLDEVDGGHEAHLVHLNLYAGLAEQAAENILGAERARWLDVLEAEHDNVRAALAWGIHNDQVSQVLRLSAAMWRFWQARGSLYEAATRLEEALALHGADPAVQVKALEALGGVHWWRGKIESAAEVYERALAIHESLGDPSEIANAMYNYALARATADSSLELAEPILRDALEIYTKLGDDNGMANVYWGLAQQRIMLGDHEDVEELMEKSVERYRRAQNDFGLAWASHELGMFEYRRNSNADAWTHFQSALDLFRRANDVSGMAMALYAAAAVADRYGDHRRAYRLYGAMETVVKTSGAELSGIEANSFEDLTKETINSLTGEDHDAYESGKTLSLEDATAYALAGPVDAEPQST